MTDPFTALSDQLAARVAVAAPGLVSIYPGTRAERSGFAWQTGLVVTSEQDLPPGTDVPVMLPGGGSATAVVAGRDPGTNIALLRLEIEAPALGDSTPATGAMVLAMGSERGEPTVSLGVVHRTGPAWESMAGGTIDRLIRLELRLSSRAEGGPVVTASGALVGFSTFGPRRRVLVIPAGTVRRMIPLLVHGSAPRGWLGVGLQPVGLPAALQAALQPGAGRETGLMVMSLAPDGPAEQAGVLPGDILLDVSGVAAPTPRAVARAMVGAIMGQPVPLRLLRGGAPIELSVTPSARPGA